MGSGSVRHFAALSYNDMYEMIKKALIGEDKKLHDQAWDLLFGKGERNSDLIWMRMQLLCETWEHADGKGREELMCLAMDHIVSDGMARKLETFTDLDGQQYHQYMFCDFFGCDMNYIRRIPFGYKEQEKYSYENMLTQYETPANFMRVMVESTEMRRLKEEHFKSEAEKIIRVLKDWKQNPTKSKKELGVVPWVPEDSDEDPLTERELNSMKNFLKKHDPVSSGEIFADEPIVQ